MFMGGNYLPDTEEGEVEIARIEIASTTFDVTCLFAKQNNGRILYRVVDEYEGDTLTRTKCRTNISTKNASHGGVSHPGEPPC
jgi:hypothetical protein